MSDHSPPPEFQELEEATAIANALGNPLRMKILLLLGFQQSPMTYASIATVLGINNKTIGFHLKELENRKLVSKIESGRHTLYTHNTETMTKFVGYLSSLLIERNS